MSRRPFLFTVTVLSACLVTALTTISVAGATAHTRGAIHAPVACRHVTARITTLRTWRTKTSAGRVWRITVPRRAQGTACGQLPASVTTLRTWRTKTSAGRVGRITVRPSAKIAYSCNWNLTIGWKADKNELNGRAWVDNCVGAVACFQVADMQAEDTTLGTGWRTIKGGSSTSGCTSADYAWVNVTCYDDPDNISYRTLGIFTVDWVNGTVTGPVDKYSPTWSFKKSCA